MKKEITAEYMHDLLKQTVFKDVDLSKIDGMSDEERRLFTVAEADVLLGQRPYGDSMNWYVGQFIQDEDGLRNDNPLTEEETTLVDWYIELAWLGFNLIDHHPFNLDTIEPGLAQHPDDPALDYTIQNEPLMNWLRTTSYRHLAVMIVRMMLDREYHRVVGHFDAVQDYYAEHCTTDTGKYLQKSEMCDKYINEVIGCIETVDNHQKRGRQLGLNDDEMRVVDALWGWMPHDYDHDYVEAAHEICKTVEMNLPERTVIRSRNGFMIYKKPVLKKLETITDKHELDIDLTDAYNITMGYLTEWLYSKYMGREMREDEDPIG